MEEIILIKKRYLFLIIVVCLFAISTVSAEKINNETNDVLSAGNEVSIINQEIEGQDNIINTTNEILGVKEDTSSELSFESGSGINIDAPEVTKCKGGPEKFVVTIKDDSGNPIVNAEVKIKLNGVYYSRTTDYMGQVSMGLGLSTGNYDVVVECDGVEIESRVIIKSTVGGEDITKIFRNATQYYAQFVDANDNPLVNAPVEFNINGIFYTRTTNNQGIAKMNINLNPGNYIITATNPDSGEKFSNNIRVLPNIIENRDLTKYYKNGSQYVIRVLDDKGNPATGKSVLFNINGVFYTRTSNSMGYVKLNINLAPNTYIITAEYNGYKTSNLIKVLSILESRDLSMRFRDGSQFEVKLLDGHGNPFASQKITFNINGVLYERTTNANGVASLKINLMANNYIITSSYNGLNVANTIQIANDPIYYTIGTNQLDYNYYMNEYNKFSWDWYYVDQYESNVKTIYDIFGNQGMEIQNVRYGIKYEAYEASTGKEIWLNSAGEVISWSYGRGYSEVYIIYDEFNNILARGRWTYD